MQTITLAKNSNDGRIFIDNLWIGKDRLLSMMRLLFYSILLWVRGLMAINVGCEFSDWSSIPSVCMITDDGLGQVDQFKP